MSAVTILFLAAFLACLVEMVEALTIVLAAGVVRGWRSPLLGVGAAVAVLAVIVAALGPALRLVEDEASREGRADAEAAARVSGDGIDWYSFTVAFKGVLLEGLEVAFIVVTFGGTQRRMDVAVVAAALALVVVLAAGLAI
jgi:uncharacterized membrane protein